MPLAAALLALLMLALVGSPASAQGRRVALVIGNDTYAHAPPLLNPGRDATAIAAALKRIGFAHVEVQRDLGIDALRRALLAFEPLASGADIALVFFAGHGIEADGTNYLIPTDARLARANGVELEAVALPTVTAAISGARKLRLVILDSCRNNPFQPRLSAEAGRKRSIGRGLARVEPGDNELIAFAAAAGTVADDGETGNSPFTTALLKHLERPGLEVQQLFRAVRDEVITSTARGQVPHVYGTLGAEPVYFRVPEVADADAARKASEAEIARRVATERTRIEAEMAAKLDAEKKRLAGAAPSPPPQLPPNGEPAGAAPVAGPAPSPHTSPGLPVPPPPATQVLVPIPANPVAPGMPTRMIEAHQAAVTSVAISPDGRTIVSGSGDKSVKLWEASSGRMIRSLEGHPQEISSLAVSPDGRTILSGSGGSAKVWDMATGRLVRSLDGHKAWISSLAVSPDGRMAATGSDDHTVKLWDIATGRTLRTLGPHKDRVWTVAVSPDGKTVASGSWEAVTLWDAATGRQIRTLAGHQHYVHFVVMFPDGRTYLSGDGSKIKVWQAATGRLLRTLEGHGDTVQAAAVSPDGRTIITGSDDSTLKLWAADTGRLLHSLAGHPSKVTSLAISPDGRWFVSGGCDVKEFTTCSRGSVKIWAMP